MGNYQVTSQAKPILSTRRKLLIGLATAYPVAILVLSAVHLFFPQRSGLLALTQVFAFFLFLPLLLLAPFAFMRGAILLRIVLAMCFVVCILRFFPQLGLARATENPEAVHLDVMSWNYYNANSRLEEARRYLYTKPADVVALPEASASWVTEDPTIARVYPYRLAYPQSCRQGIALLSVYPFAESNNLDTTLPRQKIPRMCWARLEVGKGKTVTVIVGHPVRPDNSFRRCPFAGCFNTAERDQQIRELREAASITQRLEEGEPLLLMGDFNVTEREPAYSDLSAGLQDAHLRVGVGSGTTWGPLWLMNLGVSVVRIDYMFSSPNVNPITMSVDCTLRGSDHCVVKGRFEIK